MEANRNLSVVEGVDVLARNLEVDVGRDETSLHGDDHLGDWAQTRGGLGVADVWLDGADRQRRVSSWAEHILQSLHFLWISHLPNKSIKLRASCHGGIDCALLETAWCD